MPLSPSQGFKLGQQWYEDATGQNPNFTGFAQAKSLTNMALQSKISQNQWLEKQLIEKGIGIQVKNGQVNFPEWLDTPAKQQLGLHSYQKMATEAFGKSLDNVQKIQQIREREREALTKEIKNFNSPDAQKNAIQARIEAFNETFGNDIGQAVNIGSIMNSFFEGGSIEKEIDGKLAEAYWAAREIYNQKPTDANMMKIAKVFGAMKEDNRKGLETPQVIQTKKPTLENQEREFTIQSRLASMRSNLLEKRFESMYGGGEFEDQDIKDAGVNWLYDRSVISGLPRNSPERTRIQRAGYQAARDRGIPPENIAALRNATAAQKTGLSLLDKQISATSSAVANIDMQTIRAEEIMQELGNIDARLLNVPLNQLRRYAAATPALAEMELYIAELASEAGKLAGGGATSAAEVSVSAREHWQSVITEDAPISVLSRQFKALRNLGGIRMKSLRDTYQWKLKNDLPSALLGVSVNRPAKSKRAQSIAKEYQKMGFSIEQTKRAVAEQLIQEGYINE